jgi:hypothetical protein
MGLDWSLCVWEKVRCHGSWFAIELTLLFDLRIANQRPSSTLCFLWKVTFWCGMKLFQASGLSKFYLNADNKGSPFFFILLLLSLPFLFLLYLMSSSWSVLRKGRLYGLLHLCLVGWWSSKPGTPYNGHSLLLIIPTPHRLCHLHPLLLHHHHWHPPPLRPLSLSLLYLPSPHWLLIHDTCGIIRRCLPIPSFFSLSTAYVSFTLDCVVYLLQQTLHLVALIKHTPHLNNKHSNLGLLMTRRSLLPYISSCDGGGTMNMAVVTWHSV